jgi:hypothetical protein
VGAGDGVFHGATHAFVVVYRVRDVAAALCVWGVAAAREEDDIFGVHGLACVGVVCLIERVGVESGVYKS